MYAVIFRAEIASVDAAYAAAAQRLRQIALERYGCLDFVSVCEDKQEIAISYWPDAASIAAWKADAEHQTAQEQGRGFWYGAYQVEVARIERRYRYEKGAPR